MQKDELMRHFSSTELANKTGDVLAAAAQEPVYIQRHGKSRYVLMSVEQFERMNACADQRRAVHIDHLEDDETQALITVLEDSLE